MVKDETGFRESDCGREVLHTICRVQYSGFRSIP